MPVWLNIFFAVLLVSIIVMEVAENGHPIRTLAWILVLTFLPVVGLVLYFFFGRDRKNRRMVSAEDLERLQANSLQACRSHIREDIPAEHLNLITLLYSAGHFRCYAV